MPLMHPWRGSFVRARATLWGARGVARVVVAVDVFDTGVFEAMLCIAKSRFGLVAMFCVDLGIRYVYWMLCVDDGGLVRDVYIVLGLDVQMI